MIGATKCPFSFTRIYPKKYKTNNVANGIPTIRSLNHLLSSGSKMYKKTFSFPELWVAVCLVEIIFNRNHFQDFFDIFILYIYYTCCVIFLGNLCHKKWLFSKKWMPFRESHHGNKYGLWYSKGCNLFLEASALTSKWYCYGQLYLSPTESKNKETNVEKFLSSPFKSTRFWFCTLINK